MAIDAIKKNGPNCTTSFPAKCLGRYLTDKLPSVVRYIFMKQEYWQYISNGKHGSFAEFYKEYFKKFYNYGRKFTNETTLIEDSIQEVFLLIWTKRDKIDTIALPNAYFFSTFKYILLEKIKTNHRSEGFADREMEPDFTIEETIISQENESAINNKLLSAMNTLTPRQKQVIFLRFYEGLSYEEVAVIMNITVKATYKIVARSLLSLRESIKVILLLIANYRSDW